MLSVESPSSSVTVTNIEYIPSSIHVQFKEQLLRITFWLAVEYEPSSNSISNVHQTIPPSSSKLEEASMNISSFVQALWFIPM